MASLWYCCECNFGPHNSALYGACISCGERRCSFCPEEKCYDSLRTSSHTHCHEASPYPSAVSLDTAQTPSLNTTSMPAVLPDLPGIRPLSQLRSASTTAKASLWNGPAKMYGHGAMYVCCQCNDGPKLWDNQPRCVNCQHIVCSNCEYLK